MDAHNNGKTYFDIVIPTKVCKSDQKLKIYEEIYENYKNSKKNSVKGSQTTMDVFLKQWEILFWYSFLITFENQNTDNKGMGENVKNS